MTMIDVKTNEPSNGPCSKPHMGYSTSYKNGIRVYEDTGEPIDEVRRPCNNCGMYRGDNRHDPCISDLPGVKNACCGHGAELGYILFENGTRITMDLREVKKSIKFGDN